MTGVHVSTAPSLSKAIDPATRLRTLLAAMSRRTRLRFLTLIDEARRDLGVGRLEKLIASGRTEQALLVLDRAGALLAAEVVAGFLGAGAAAARRLEAVGIRVAFDVANDRAVRAMAARRLDLIREFRNEQRAAVREVLVDGIRRGTNPRQIARDFRAVIGLTERQAAIVLRYRRSLESLSADALGRALRDRRFDSTVQTAIANQEPLSAAQVDRMVDRYAARWRKYRAEVIGRTEALRSVHEGTEELYRQAIDSGLIAADNLVRTWNTALDGRVRDTHASMHGQKRPYGVPFTSGAGASLRYPGDPLAPAADTVQCRCVVATRILKL